LSTLITLKFIRPGEAGNSAKKGFHSGIIAYNTPRASVWEGDKMKHNKDPQDPWEKELIPDPGLPVWRYMDFHKFISLLHFQRLHFTRADKFEDVFERKMANLLLRDWPPQQKDSFERIRRRHRDAIPRTFTSCWTNLDKESYAMWQIYAKENGVAVQTTVANLEKALGNSGVKIRKVHYLDLGSEDEGYRDPAFWDEKKGILAKNFFVCKPKAYEYEREIRAVFVADREEGSVNLPVDVNILIENIYISPFVGGWFVDLVEDLVSRQYHLREKGIFMSDIQLNKGPS
jgi:hypothetical protein